MNINLTAVIKSKPAKAETLKVLLLNLVANSRKEEACLKYELQQSSEDENIFIFHEIWRDQQGLDLHEQQEHFLAFGKAATELLADSPVLYKTQVIS